MKLGALDLKLCQFSFLATHALQVSLTKADQDLVDVVILFLNVGFNLLDDLLKMHEAGLLAFKVLKQRRICFLEELILVARNVFRFELMQLILDFLYAILQLVTLMEERRVHVMVV